MIKYTFLDGLINLTTNPAERKSLYLSADRVDECSQWELH